MSASSKNFLTCFYVRLRAINDAIREQNNPVRVDSESYKRDRDEAAKVIAQAINAASDSAGSYERPQRDREYRLQRFTVILTFFAAVGAIAAAFANLWVIPQIKKSADAAHDAAVAAKSAAETASGTLAENKRQFDLMFPQVQQQTLTSQQSLSLQSSPYIVISIIDAKTSRLPVPRGWHSIIPREVEITYQLENQTAGSALTYAAGLRLEDLGQIGPMPPPTGASACNSQMETIRTALPRHFDGLNKKGPFREKVRIGAGNVVRGVGCVAYKSVDAKIHTNAVLVSIRPSYLIDGGQLTKTTVSVSAIPTENP